MVDGNDTKIIVTKVCSRCLTEKNHADFTINKRNRDGLDTYCRSCLAMAKKRYHKEIKVVTPGMKTCGNCRISKPHGDFYTTNSSGDGYASVCKICQRKNARVRKLNRDYGMSEYQYEIMLKSQENVCAICGEPETRKQYDKIRALSVDHDHKTHKVRGLLCHKCNTALGGFNDDPELLIKAINHLKEKS